MNNNQLKSIKKNYEYLKNAQEEMISTIKRRKELAQTPEVQEFFRLSEKIYSFNTQLYDDVKNANDEQLIELAIKWSSNIVDSNHIFVCMGTYRIPLPTFSPYGPVDYEVQSDNQFADYKVYADIEKNDIGSTFKVSIEECEEFEKNNIVLYPNGKNADDYYDEIRHLFFETAMNEGQEKAIAKILVKKENKS